MQFIESIFPPELIEAAGWMIFHSIWQGAVLCVITVALVFLLRTYSSRTRYIVACCSLLVMLIWASITFVKSYNYAVEKTATKNELITSPEEMTDLFKASINGTGNTEYHEMSAYGIRWIRFRGFMQRNFNLVFMLWLAGVVFFLFRMTGGITHLHRLRTARTSSLDTKWKSYISDLSVKMGIKKKITALQSALVQVPMVIGYLKPVLLLPVSILSGLSVKELEAVIAHELAHIKRHDYILNIIQSIIETIFFFHPGIWYISNIIRNEREHSCDELAITMTGDKISYVKALAGTQQIYMKNNSTYAVAFSSGKVSLLQRVKQIKNQNNMKNNVTEGFIAASVVFISLVLLSFTFDNKNFKTDINPQPDVDNSVTVAARPETFPEVTKVPSAPMIVFSKDSLDARVEDLQSVSEEMEQVIEIAYSDREFAESIALSIEAAMREVDMERLMEDIRISLDEAMKEIDMERIMEDAQRSIDEAMNDREIQEEIRKSLEEAKIEMEEARVEMEAAMKEKRLSEEEARIAQEAMKAAQAAMDELNIDDIVLQSIESARVALESIDISEIVNESLEAAMEAIEDIDIDLDIDDIVIDIEDFDEPDSRSPEQSGAMEETLDELENEKE